MNKIYIKDVKVGSIAYESGIRAGDNLVRINEEDIKDILDYKYLLSDEYLEVEIERNGEEYVCEIEKTIGEDIGLEFNNELIERPKQCANHCLFCFMDQLPEHVRPTLIFKDDDYRLSFLSGNYVTMTNMSMKDIDRIIQYHLSPINISVQATDTATRERMLNNKNAGKLLEFIKKLYDNNIHMNGQIVLCKDINDGEILKKSIYDLSKFSPYMQSISIVPVGLTKYREGLFKLNSFDRESSREVIEQVSSYQKELKKKLGTSLVYLADEFYLKAGEKTPSYSHYEDFPQIENGVGMVALFEQEFKKELAKVIDDGKGTKVHISIATGAIAYDYILSVCSRLEEKIKGLNISLFKIENEYFGNEITVTGLLVGQDIINQLKDKNLGEKLYICESMLKDDEDIFLDDVTLSDVKKELNIDIIPISNKAKELISHIIKLRDKK